MRNPFGFFVELLRQPVWVVILLIVNSASVGFWNEFLAKVSRIGRADRWLELLVLRALGCIARGSVLLAKSRFGEKTDAPNCCRSNSAWFIDRSIVAFLLADRDHLLDVCAQLLISRNITLRFHVKFFSSVRPVTVKLSE
jgi:hypothetical protein